MTKKIYENSSIYIFFILYYKIECYKDKIQTNYNPSTPDLSRGLKRKNMIIPRFVLIKNNNKKVFPEGMTSVKMGNALFNDIFIDKENAIDLEYRPKEKSIIIKQFANNNRTVDG